MKAIFVTGTDTGVGKTVVTGLLAKFLKQKGYKVITQKWIQTGSRNFPSDISLHLKIMGIPKERVKHNLSLMSPYIFRFPASPHLAARKEKRNIQIEKIKRSFNKLKEDFDFLIVEGIGGALVPINPRKLVIDVAGELKLPVLIVAANKLGAINHTLLTIEALKRRKIKIVGLIFNNISSRTKKIIAEDNPRIIKALSKQKILGILPCLKDKSRLYKEFIPIGEKIIT